MATQLKGELRDLLIKSYSRLNDLNGLFKKKDLTDELMKNGLKCKLKAKNLFYGLHHFLDASYAQLLKSIDSTVAEISSTLNEHSSEIDNCVNYMAQICLIAERFLKDESSHIGDGSEIIDKLSETLMDSSILKTVDYNACVSLDINVDLKSLFDVPFIYFGSHKGDQGRFSKLHTFKLDDFKVQRNVSAQNADPHHLKSSHAIDPEASPGFKDQSTKLPSAQSLSREHHFSAHITPDFKEEEDSKFPNIGQTEVSTIGRYSHGGSKSNEKEISQPFMGQASGKNETYVSGYEEPRKDPVFNINTKMAHIQNNGSKDGSELMKQSSAICIPVGCLTDVDDDVIKQSYGNHSQSFKMKSPRKEPTPLNWQRQSNVFSKPFTSSKCTENFESPYRKEMKLMQPPTQKKQDFDNFLSETYTNHLTTTYCTQNDLENLHLDSIYSPRGNAGEKVLSFNTPPNRQT